MQVMTETVMSTTPAPVEACPIMWTWAKGAPLKRVDKAKKEYLQARQEGRFVTDLDDKPVDFFHRLLDQDNDVQGFKIKGQALGDGEFSMRILNDKGDETIMFDANVPDMVAKAEKQFNDYTKKGWTAYVVSRDGKTKRQITMFNAEMKEITFIEPGKSGPSVKERLSSFVKSFGVVQVLPATAKG